jgi:hypothetical protein
MRKAVLVLAALVLSGCSQDGGDGGELQDAGLEDLGLEATDTTGIIRGVVVNEAIVPVPDVNITAVNAATEVVTQTNAEGFFGFDGLEPGTYFVSASKFGFIPVQTSVDVVAGEDEPDVTKLILSVDQALQPYVQVEQYTGYIGCSVTTPSISAAVCGLPGLAEATNNAFLKNFRANQPPAWIQMEAIWSSTQPLGGELSMSVTALGPPQVTVNSTSGTSPIFLTINETEAAKHHFGVNDTDITMRLFSTELTGTDVVPEEVAHGAYATAYPTLNSTPLASTYQQVVDAENSFTGLLVNPFTNPECIQYPALFASCYGVGGAGLVVNQQVDVYTQIFYGYTPPAGWRFSEDSNIPQPQ